MSFNKVHSSNVSSLKNCEVFEPCCALVRNEFNIFCPIPRTNLSKSTMNLIRVILGLFAVPLLIGKVSKIKIGKEYYNVS